jgi:hypothetical protein
MNGEIPRPELSGRNEESPGLFTNPYMSFFQHFKKKPSAFLFFI